MTVATAPIVPVAQRLGALSAAPWFDQAIATDLLALVGVEGAEADDYLWSLRGAGVTIEDRRIARVAEPLRTEMRQSLYSQNQDLYRRALGVFARHALNGSGPALATVLGERGARVSAHAIACVAALQSPSALAALIDVVQEESERFQSDSAKDVAGLLEAYQFGSNRSSDFFVGLSFWTQGRRIEAQPHFERVLSYPVEDRAAAIAGHLLGVASHSMGDLPGAISLLRSAGDVLRAIQDSDGLIMTLTTLGRVERDQYRSTHNPDNLSASIDALTEARDLSTPDSPSRGRVLLHLAQSLLDAGDSQAVILGEAAVEMLSDDEEKVAALTNLSLMYREVNDFARFGHWLAEAMALANQLDVGGLDLAILLNVQAGLDRRSQHWASAIQNARASLTLGRRLRDKRHIAHASHTLAAIGTDILERHLDERLSHSEILRLLLESRQILVGLRDSRGIEKVDRTWRRFSSARSAVPVDAPKVQKMIDTNQIAQIADRIVYGSGSDKIGKAGQVYIDDETGQPEWVTVNTGLLGTNESFVPLREASVTGDGVSVPYTKDKVKGAPHVDPSAGHITPEEEGNLYEYYGLTQVSAAVGGNDQPYERTADVDHDDAGDDADMPSVVAGRSGTFDAGQGRDTSGPTTDDAMTRSEEQLNVGFTTRESGKARLRKYVVTEKQTVTVPVTREEVRLEREPITDANIGDATAGPDISEEEHEVTLHEEQVVVEKKAVPVERVKLGTETVTEEKQVTEQVRKEQIDTHGVEGTSAGTSTQQDD